ncbi:MAG TPA: MarR family transcriptional regulator [Spirochaetota bacterium]|nr:MarR family transcriptional regulator [Spirochaetota bacterium]
MEIRNEITDLIQLCSRISRKAKECFPCGNLSYSELKLMHMISEKGSVSMGECARSFGLSNGAVTQMADKLLEEKMIRREEDPSDRRRLISVLTQKGIGVLNDFNRCAEKLSSELSSGMNEEDSANLSKSISLINKALIRMLESKPDIKNKN